MSSSHGPCFNPVAAECTAIPGPPAPSPRFTAAAFDSLRERCRALGLAVWRCDNRGLVLNEPDEPSPLGLLFRSPTFAGLITGRAKEWGSDAPLDIVELFEGCWAIPLEEVTRRRRTALTILVAFGIEALHGPRLAHACDDAKIDLSAVRRLLLQRARYTHQACLVTRQSLLWMMQDLGQISEQEQTAAGFTRQLTDSYETIDLLYSLGRSMSDLTQPDRFMNRICERVMFTLGFGWVGVWLDGDQGRGKDLLRARTYLGGECPYSTGALDTGIREALAGMNEGTERLILTELNGLSVPGSGQLLVQPITREGRAVAAVVAGNKQGEDPQVSSYDIQLLEASAGFIGAFLDNAAMYAEQRAMFLGMLEALTASIDAKDRYTCGHSHRVAHLAQQLALAAGLSTEQAERVRIAGLVHDVGKIGVPEAVLCKTGRLSDEEFALIRKHPEIGHRILRDIPRMEDILPGVLHHHERYDGRGYPHGLKGEEIPLLGRIIAIADTFDAMSSTRSYRAALPRPAVLAELQNSAGTQLDPRLVPLFIKLSLSTYDQMVMQHAAAQPEALARAA